MYTDFNHIFTITTRNVCRIKVKLCVTGVAECRKSGIEDDVAKELRAHSRDSAASHLAADY